MSAPAGVAQRSHKPAQRLQAATAWSLRAACTDVDPELFYTETPGPNNTALAQQVCRDCPVQVQCLTYALDHKERWGVWGGMTADQRKQLLRWGGEVLA